VKRLKVVESSEWIRIIRCRNAGRIDISIILTASVSIEVACPFLLV
jgi:hypothetical protein